jgi:hypothetical protein
MAGRCSGSACCIREHDRRSDPCVAQLRLRSQPSRKAPRAHSSQRRRQHANPCRKDNGRLQPAAPNHHLRVRARRGTSAHQPPAFTEPRCSFVWFPSTGRHCWFVLGDGVSVGRCHGQTRPAAPEQTHGLLKMRGRVRDRPRTVAPTASGAPRRPRGFLWALTAV